MSGHPHWRGQASARPGRSGFRRARAARPARSGGASRRGLLAFAAAMSIALGSVLTMIVASSARAMAETAMFSDPKSDSWVGMAAVSSVLVCALLGMAIVYRYTSRRQH